MHALVRHGDDPAWVRKEVADPVAGPSDVVIAVAAAGLNRADLLMRSGDYVPTGADWAVPLDRVGFEMAGRVVAVGPDVTGVREGDRVMAQTGGACAELVAVDHRLLLGVPDGLDWTGAAGLPSALLTEFDALATAELRDGERVVITGASSGVGLVGVQLARALGAGSVVATTRSAAKAPLLRELGADAVTPSLVDDVAAGTVDVALDHLGGTTLADLVALAAPGARIVQIGRLAGRNSTIDLEVLAAHRVRLIGTTFRGRSAAELHDLVARVRALLPDLVERHRVRAVVDSVFDLADAERAAARLDAPDLTGKVVLRVN
ncbi:zinc-binding dehydrogenase [Amycolatopsis sp. CA-230715]|uniref:zinc-binding dehydrogenase n=1 Tax=Amycolatopsis sp. CA-230715 TaxID=2745196 RepID=UPI001C035F5B|nr:zinc-binding dehydrogenase [Amycolatopsis sp. CA-230715]QWF84367.1 Narbonolide/10-deoxymethynolide synthase PikA2, modules 3 and 4 [Amycolatopsis sp. CA-230715]